MPYNYTQYSPQQQQPCLLPCCNPIYSPSNNAFNINSNSFRSPSRSLRYSLPPQQTYQVVPIKQARRPLINQFSDSLPQLFDYNSIVQLRTFGRAQPPISPSSAFIQAQPTNSYLNQNSLQLANNNNTVEARRSPYYYNDLATLRIGDTTTSSDPNKNLKYFPTNRYEPHNRIDINEFDFENHSKVNDNESQYRY